MSLLLDRPTTVAVQAVSREAVKQCRNHIAEFQNFLRQSVQETEGTDKHTLRLWLIGAAARLSNVDSSRVWRRVACLLPAGGHCDRVRKACCLQLLELVCEVDPAKVGHLLSLHPRIVRYFFQDQPQHISTWFQSSYVGSISEFTNGAKALAQYALLHRAEMWDLLSWQGKHAQAPVAVAAKPHYFSELDVNKTMRNILRQCPEFFASEQFISSVSSGTITALDRASFCQELCKMLIDGDADIRAAIKSCVLQQPFKLICHRLLHLLDDDSLLDFLNNILGQSYSQRQLQQLVSTDMPLPDSPVGRALWASQRLEQCLQLLVFGCVTWQELDSLSMNVALAFHYSHLQKAVEASDQHQGLYKLSSLLCDSVSVPVYWALLSEEAQKSDSRMYLTMMLYLWAVQCMVAQQLAMSEHEQIRFMANNGIRASTSVSAQHALLRPSKRRKSHKHKRRRSAKRRRRSLPEDWVPSSGEESMLDGDLGIMAPDQDHHDQLSPKHAVWQIELTKPILMEVHATTVELPSMLLCNVIMSWLETLQKSGLTP